MIKVRTRRSNRVAQGDIYKDVEWIEYVDENRGILSISKITFPYVIVLTQDCDLEQDIKNRKKPNTSDKKHDKYLFSVLVAPLYNVEHFKRGEHLSNLRRSMRADINWDRTEGEKIRNNELPRYHYLEFPSGLDIVNSIIDFKHYFSVNIELLHRERNQKFVCSVCKLYREEISDRFAFFLARIGLPDLHPR